jgi:RNA polymerase sigma-70 factor (ECF subfamily)
MTRQEQDVANIRRLIAGDSRGLEELYDRYTPLIYPVMLRILRSRADAEDALQETWVKVWRTASTYDGRRGPVAAWLLTVARTRALDRYRSSASRKRAEAQAETVLPPPAEDPSSRPARNEIGQRVRIALGSLEPQHRRVLESAYFDGLSQMEIAARLGAPLGTVKSWTRQALTRLRELLPHEEWA